MYRRNCLKKVLNDSEMRYCHPEGLSLTSVVVSFIPSGKQREIVDFTSLIAVGKFIST